MDCKMKNELGTISIAEEVVATIAGLCCLECYGIVAMGTRSASDGIVEMFKKDNPSKGVKVTVKETGVSIAISIVVEYGVSIAAVAKTAIESIKYHIESMTGTTVEKVSVVVAGIRV